MGARERLHRCRSRQAYDALKKSRENWTFNFGTRTPTADSCDRSADSLKFKFSRKAVIQEFINKHREEQGYQHQGRFFVWHCMFSNAKQRFNLPSVVCYEGKSIT
jgi:hypothetical protein